MLPLLLAAWLAPAAAADSPADLDAALVAHEARRRRADLASSATLTAWAGGNLVVGAVGMGLTAPDGPDWVQTERAQWFGFHAMSAGWNVINLSLGLPGLIGALKEPTDAPTLGGVLRSSADVRLIYGLNTGLDVGWMAIGAWLWERGLREDQPLLTGMGQSMVLQGAFLFVFDLTLTAWHGRQFKDLMITPVVGEQLGVAVTGRF